MPSDFILLAYGRNFPYLYEVQLPLSLFTIGAYLEEHGFTVEYYDERVEPRSRFDTLLARGPLAVGLSVMGGFQIESSLALTRRARKLSPRSRVVWGGAFPSVMPETVLDESGADFLVLGEGEETMLELAGALASGTADFSSIRGLGWRDAGHSVINGRRPPPDLERLPFPFHGKVLPLLRRHLKERAGKPVGYETSRGCPFSCGFCYSQALHGRVMAKSPAKVRRELAALRGLGVSNLEIYDDILMGGDQAKVLVLAEQLGAGPFSWDANLRVDMLSGGLLRRLEASGCNSLYFGLESEDDRVLKTIGKGFNSGQVHAGLELLRGSGISTIFSIITGLPAEDGPIGAGPALDMAEKIHHQHPRAEIQIQSFVPWPGSGLYPEALRLGWRAPRNLQGWVEHDHFSVRLPWSRDPALPAHVCLSSFLAWRYRRLSHFPAFLVFWPFHLLSLFRVRHRFFKLYIEGYFYAAAMGALRLRNAACSAREIIFPGRGE